jgi:hypothetical protein
MKRRLNQLHSNRPGRFSTSHISDMWSERSTIVTITKSDRGMKRR